MEEKIVKITDKIVSIPPYLSTSWGSIAHIRTVGDRLIFTMRDGESVSVPGFPDPLIKQVFECHIQYLEAELTMKVPKNFRLPDGMVPPSDLFKVGFASPDMLNMMQHNGEQRNLPSLPDEVVDKISKILKVVAPLSDPEMFPKPEPHCNCPYCQVARSLHHIKKEEVVEQEVEEVISTEELTFSQFEISAAGDKLFHVVDKLFPAERFTVFLGDPVGCTCGRTGCEHLIAVLKS